MLQILNYLYFILITLSLRQKGINFFLRESNILRIEVNIFQVEANILQAEVCAVHVAIFALLLRESMPDRENLFQIENETIFTLHYNVF